jgi:type IV secretion system protein VirB6
VHSDLNFTCRRLRTLFILCLLFKQTAPLFQKWLLYGIGTVFSLGVLSIMVTISMKMLAAVTAAYVAQYVASMTASGITGGAVNLSTDGLNSMALQQGGIGLILTTLIISAPPMAAAFFQGTLGQFGAYSAFGRIGEGSASSRQQTALGQHTVAGVPASNRGIPGAQNSAGVSLPQITGSSGYTNNNPQSIGPGTYGLANGSGSMGPGS